MREREKGEYIVGVDGCRSKGRERGESLVQLEKGYLLLMVYLACGIYSSYVTSCIQYEGYGKKKSSLSI